MQIKIKHEIKGRIRLHLIQKRMSYVQADTLLFYLQSLSYVKSVKVYERTQDVAIEYEGEREVILKELKEFSYDCVKLPEGVIENSGRELNAIYQEKLVNKFVVRWATKLFLPCSIRTAYIVAKSITYIWKGLKSIWKRRIEVALLDAIAISVSLFQRDFDTANSVMFLLGIGELLEEWTHKKSVGDLARSMSLHIEKVWTLVEGQEVLVPFTKVNAGDIVVVHMGNIIPFDGVVIEGEGEVNQSTMTGEAMPVKKAVDGYVYAGTVLEEGELVIEVKEGKGSSRFEKIVTMIEDSEKLKSSVESKAEHLADQLVPVTLLATGLVYGVTRNVMKALAVLMVDFSCALKLAMPISVLSAIREASTYNITVKGGKFLETVAEADVIVFDKTGTLTEAKPKVIDVIAFGGNDELEMLRMAACMEEHFPHSMAKAVVSAAKKRSLEHEEMHSKVDYIVAHGISTTIEGKKAIIGSRHFVFDDEESKIPEGEEDKFQNLKAEYTNLYLAIEGYLAGVICIEDPIRPEAKKVISTLRKCGIKKVVMMTGDSEKTASSVARAIGVDEYYSEVLPEDKAFFVEKEKGKGRKVIMIGDGVNDSPALSAADVGIAISDGAEIAREIADITIDAIDLYELVYLKKISDKLMRRINENYRFIVGFNTLLIVLGVGGLIQPATSALLHNTSTLGVSLKSMNNLIIEEKTPE